MTTKTPIRRMNLDEFQFHFGNNPHGSLGQQKKSTLFLILKQDIDEASKFYNV